MLNGLPVTDIHRQDPGIAARGARAARGATHAARAARAARGAAQAASLDNRREKDYQPGFTMSSARGSA